MIKKIGFVIVFLLFNFLSATEIRLKPRVNIKSNKVILADVVKSHNLAKSEYEELKSIIIKEMDKDEYFVNVSASLLKNKIKYIAEKEVDIIGGICSVRRYSGLISEDEIKKQARNFLQQKYPNEKNIQLTFFSIPKIKRLEDDYSVTFASNSKFNRAGNIILDGRINFTEQKSIKFKMNVRVEVMKKVAVLQTSKNRNEIIDNDDIKMLLLSVQEMNTVITDPKKAIGKLAKRYLSPNTILKNQYLKEQPAVQRGEKVDVEVVVGPVLLSYQAISREEGYIGEEIICQNPDSREKFLAKVIGENRLQIKLEEK